MNERILFFCVEEVRSSKVILRFRIRIKTFEENKIIIP